MPTLAQRGSRSCILDTCALYGAIINTSSSVSVDLRPSWSIHDELAVHQVAHQRRHHVGLFVGVALVACVLHRQKAQPRAGDRPGRDDALPVQAGARVEPAFVERLGRVGANVGVHTKGLVHEQPFVTLYGTASVEQVSQRRSIRAVGMRAQGGLVKLLRVAEQHQVRRGVRDCQRVRQRHLPRLVHEQRVHAVLRFRTRPQPGGAGPDLAIALETPEHVAIVGGQNHAHIARVVHVVRVPAAYLSHRLNVQFLLIGGVKHAFQQVDDDLMAVGADAHALAVAYQFGNHARAGERLARAGRPLDGQHAERAARGDAPGGVTAASRPACGWVRRPDGAASATAGRGRQSTAHHRRCRYSPRDSRCPSAYS